jgi:DNA-binding ferritin-like protein
MRMAIARILNNYVKKQDEKEVEETLEGDDESKSSSACPCIAKLMEINQSVHLAHWATESRAEHKALGKLYEGMDALIDTFVETLIGIKGRGVISGISSLKVYGSTGGDCSKIVDELEELIRDEVKEYIDDDEDGLLNIQADMLNLVTHTKYLLTLK